MDLSIYPLCYHDSLFDDEMDRRECGDGVYVSTSSFRRLMNNDNEDMMVFRITCGDREVFCHICGTHNGPDDAVYVPMWGCNVLGCYGEETVQIERAHPSIGLKIKIKPHETRYADKDDPVAVLRDAFENYACLTSGADIPLMIDGEQLVVSVLETTPAGPICIRGVELEVEIEGEPTVPAPTTALEPETVPMESVDFTTAMLPTRIPANKRQRTNDMVEPPNNVSYSDDPRFPGPGYRLGGPART